MTSLPDLPQSDFKPIERNPASLQSDALLGQSGILGALQGLQTESSSASLFGIEDSGQRILILFDNSASVLNKASKAGVSTDRFVKELTTLINGLNANTLFGLIPFYTRCRCLPRLHGGGRNEELADRCGVDWLPHTHPKSSNGSFL